MGETPGIVVPAAIAGQIVIVRGRRVLLDADLARLYGVPTSRFNEAVKRNRERFPPDFMFQLTAEEAAAIVAQAATRPGRGGRRYLPRAFTEHGAIMAASLLDSPLAIETSVYVVRAFVALREAVQSHREIEAKLTALERRYDRQFKVVFDAIRQLLRPAVTPRKSIGFKPR
jgi:hypothetical protein